jgi:putative transposase
MYPTKKQETLLNGQLETCRFLYNNLLGTRKDSWENNKKSISCYDSINSIPKLKKTYPQLTSVYSQCLQNVSIRVDLAYQGFFRRLKTGEKPGYPRFRGKGRYLSICYPQYNNGCELVKNKLSLSKIGDIKVILHRELVGIPKTITIKKTPTGKWFVAISCDQVPNKKQFRKTGKEVGIDVGIISFATMNNGEKIANPRFFEKEQKELAKKQNKEKWKEVKRIHERIANKRYDFAHKTANDILNKYDFVYVEDIETNKLLKKKWCSKQISDVAWSNFANILSYKAEWAGKTLVKVNPAYTSQTCSKCGTRTLMELKDRVFACSCGLSMDRDINAAHNILRLGKQSLAVKSIEAPIPLG